MASSISRSVVKKILSRETSEVRAFLQRFTSRCQLNWYASLVYLSQGAGALVRRSIGSPELRNLTPFLMLDHFHIGKGAVRDMMSSPLCARCRSPTYASGVICRVSPTTRIAARLQSATLFKVPVNTKTLQDTRVSFEKVACNGCARYVPPLPSSLCRTSHTNNRL